MSLSSTYISRKQLIADNLNTMGETTADVSDGLTSLANKILDIPNKQSTTLTMDVPLNLEYGDDFNITGSLTSGGDGVSNATIKLKVGSTVVDTQTTDGTGAVSFTQCPVATGNHSFQLLFEGDINHASSESTVVTREVSKETSVITLNYPTASSNHYSDEAITVSGVLTDNDNTPMASKSIVVKDGDNVLKTLTTSNDGTFNDTITLTAGSHTINVIYNGDDYYTASTVSRNITIVAPSISVTSNKSILSYADSDSATLTATLNTYDKASKSVTFEVRKQSDDSLVETLTGTTNSSGIASVSYLGQGAGDLYIKAVCGLLTKTYGIEDCWKYLASATHTHNTGEDIFIDYSLSSLDDVEISADVKATNTNGYRLILTNFTTPTTGQYVWGDFIGVQCGGSGKIGMGYYKNGSSSGIDSNASPSANISNNFKIQYSNGEFKGYYDDNLIGTVSITLPSTSKNIGISAWNNQKTVTVENLKIKPL